MGLDKQAFAAFLLDAAHAVPKDAFDAAGQVTSLVPLGAWYPRAGLVTAGAVRAAAALGAEASMLVV